MRSSTGRRAVEAMASSRNPVPRRSWPAMLVAPLLALGMQSLVFSLVTPSCAHQGGIGMHALSGATLLLAALLTALAGQGWRAAALLCRRAGADPADHAPERDLFI